MIIWIEYNLAIFGNSGFKVWNPLSVSIDHITQNLKQNEAHKYMNKLHNYTIRILIKEVCSNFERPRTLLFLPLPFVCN